MIIRYFDDDTMIINNLIYIMFVCNINSASNCMSNIPSLLDLVIVNEKPGTVYTADQQCKDQKDTKDWVVCRVSFFFKLLVYCRFHSVHVIFYLSSSGVKKPPSLRKDKTPQTHIAARQD